MVRDSIGPAGVSPVVRSSTYVTRLFLYAIVVTVNRALIYVRTYWIRDTCVQDVPLSRKFHFCLNG